MKCQSNYKSENYPLFNCNKRKLNFKQKYIFIIIILINIIKISPFKMKESFQLHSNEITIKISESGYVSTVGRNYPNCPNSIKLNNESIYDNGENCGYIFIDSTNEDEIFSVKLIWNYEFDTFQGLFSNMTSMVEVDLSKFNTTSIINMHDMFYGCESLTSINFTNIVTTNLEDMGAMFTNCKSLKEVDLSSFITSKVTNMSFLFYGCQSLKSINISNFDTSEVLSMQAMFYQMILLENLDLKNFVTSKVTDMSYMFYHCISLTTLDLSNFDTSSVISMSAMFYETYNITSLDLINFNTSNVQNMENMFGGCISLVSLELSSFDTSNVYLMDYMFCECSSLSSLDLSNFVTSNVNDMGFIFYECKSLTSLHLYNFNTENVVSMDYMFYDCEKLSSINLSSFDTNKVESMDFMFAFCYSLSNINLSNFHTQQLISMEKMFYSCISLTSLDISNFNTENVRSMEALFAYCKSLLSLDLSNFDTYNVNNTSNMFSLCSNLTSLDLSNFQTGNVINMSEMFDSCEKLESLKINNFNILSVKDAGKMFRNCRSLTSLDISSFYTNNLENMNSMFSGCEKLVELDLSRFVTSSLKDAGGMFANCTNLKYINFLKYIEFTNFNIDNILDSVPDNFVICVDEINQITKLKEILDSKPCITIYCGTDWYSHQKKIDAKNKSCVDNCTNYNYEDNGKCYSFCPEGVDFCKPETTIIYTTENIHTTIINEQKTVNTQDDYSDIYSTMISSINNLIIKETNKIEIENEEIYQEIISDKMKNFNVSEGEEIVVEGKNNFFYQITVSENEKVSFDEVNNNINKFSKIDLGDCENLLKDHYHIDRNISLIIVKFEKLTNISTERSLQYEVYDPFNKTKLDLSICQNTTINIYVPVTLSDELHNLYHELKEQGYNLFDEKSDFYQDICTPFDSPNGTDVSLNDRYIYYFNNNETVCQSNCKFSNYSIESKYLKCECDISNSIIDTEATKKFKPKILYESFYDILKFSNYKVLKCLKLILKKNNIIKNQGSIITLVYFSLYLLFLIIYCFKGITQLQLDLAKRMVKDPIKIIKELNEKNKVKHEQKKFDKKSNLSNSTNKMKSPHNNERLNTHNKILKKYSQRKIRANTHYNFPPKKVTLAQGVILYTKSKRKKHKNNVEVYGNKYGDKNLLTYHKINSSYKISEISHENKTKENKDLNCKLKLINPNEKEKEIKDKENLDNLDNFELNNLEYDKAIILDKRNFLETYWSILKREHLIFFTFFVRNDYNIIYVKFSRFIFLVCTDMALNVFFFSDETMHKMFLDYGKYNFLQQIPQIVYSTIVSQLIEVFLCYLSLTDKHFYQIKNLDTSSKYKMFSIIRCVKVKIGFFFAFTFIMFLFYWYSITCFCSVYKNTQHAFIKDSITSFALGLLYPFVLYLFPAALRIIALRASKARLSCLNAISDIIPIF